MKIVRSRKLKWLDMSIESNKRIYIFILVNDILQRSCGWIKETVLQHHIVKRGEGQAQHLSYYCSMDTKEKVITDNEKSCQKWDSNPRLENQTAT